MLTLKLAFRNIFAHGQRSLIMFVAVGLASCFVFLFMAFSDGEIRNFRDGVMPIWNPPRDIWVTHQGWDAADQGGDDWKTLSSLTIPDYRPVTAQLKTIPGVAAAGMFPGGVGLDMQAGGQRFRAFWLRVAYPDNEWAIMPYIRMKSGTWLEDAATPQVVLHYKTGETLPVKPGDRVTLTGKDLFGQIVSQEAVLAGFFVPGQDNPNMLNAGYLNRSAWDLVSGFNPGEAFGISVKLADGARPGEVIQRLEDWSKATGQELEFTDMAARNQEDNNIYRMLRYIFQAVSLLIVFVVSFGVMSVVSTNLYDRKREIGTYYCLGSEKWFLIRLYTAEILILNLVATFAGIGLGLGVRQIINGIGIRTEDSGLQLVFGGSQFSLGLSLESVVFLVVLMLVVTLVTALTTLGQRLKVSPVAALRETD